MSQWLLTLKVAELTPEAAEVPASKMRVPLASPRSTETMTAADVRQAMEDAGVLPPAVKVGLFFKDDEGDFVTLPSLEVVWPSCCISNGVLKAWFMCVPEAPATTPSTPVCACLGPQVHQPSKKKLATLDKAGFEGYSLLAAARDGCATCVEYWLEKGVDPNFKSSSSEYTAMDFAMWAGEELRISFSSADQVIEVLMTAGGRANKM